MTWLWITLAIVGLIALILLLIWLTNDADKDRGVICRVCKKPLQ